MIQVLSRCYSRIVIVNKLCNITPYCNRFKIWSRTLSSTTCKDDYFSTNNPTMQKYLAYLKEEYETLQNHSDKSNESKRIKRLHELQPIMDIVNEISEMNTNLSSLNDLSVGESSDKELESLAKDERLIYESKIEELGLELQGVLVPIGRHENCSDVVLEVTAGVGGQEAMLFAREMFDMYCGFVEFKGWDVEIAQLEYTDIGGLRHASLLVSGHKAFQHLKHEAGVHRVQRIPVTEKSGRVHTSTVSVATLPQPEEVDVDVKEKDLRIETKRASGAGGQHVNTTDSAVRITHIPSGITVESQVDRSQIKNRALAMQRLRAKLFQQQLDQQVAETQATRKQQVGSSYRSEKIRTYNFNQDRITDHRIGGSLHNLRGFLSGNQMLDTLMQQLQQNENKENLLQTITNFQVSLPKPR